MHLQNGSDLMTVRTADSNNAGNVLELFANVDEFKTSKFEQELIRKAETVHVCMQHHELNITTGMCC